MEKPADAQYPLHELARRRWSPRAFSDRAVEQALLQSLFEAARWAPSSANEQPWSFLIATRDQPAEFEALLDCLVPVNQVWARRAPVLVLSVASLLRNGKPNRWAQHDVGLATENLLLEAVNLGLAAHPMAGFDAAKARATFQIPEDHEPMAALAIGYPGEPEDLPPELKQRELAARGRKSIDAFVFQGRWGERAPLVSNSTARIDGVDIDAAEPPIRAVLETQAAKWGAPFLNHRIYARRPSIFRGVRAMWTGLDASGLIDKALAALINRRVASLNRCEF
jgi:nitroreductase